MRLYYGARNLERMAYQVGLNFTFLNPQGSRKLCVLNVLCSCYRIGLKNGKLLVLRLFLCYHNQMVVGLVRLATYRFLILNPSVVFYLHLLIFFSLPNNMGFYRLLLLGLSKFIDRKAQVLCSVAKNRWLRYAFLFMREGILLLVVLCCCVQF